MEGKKVIKDLEKLVKQYIELIISDVRVEATEMFDKNFQREAFFNEKWHEGSSTMTIPVIS